MSFRVVFLLYLPKKHSFFTFKHFLLQEAVEAHELPQDGMEREEAGNRLTAEVILLISFQ